MNTDKNPVGVQSVRGFVNPTFNNNRGVISSHIVTIDSRARDYNAYPSAARFRVVLPVELKGVKSIHLVSASIPIRPFPITAADEKSVVVFIKAGQHKLKVVESINSTATEFFVDLYNEAAAVIPLINNGPADTTFWQRKVLKEFPFYAQPPLETINTLDIELRQVEPAAVFGSTIRYPLTAAVPPITLNPASTNEILLTLEIISSS